MKINEQMKVASDDIMEIAKYVSGCLIQGNAIDSVITEDLAKIAGKLEAWSIINKIHEESHGE